MPQKPKTYHYIYMTTCLITGRYYVGMHSTDNLEDGYLGSGKQLGYSRKKYGDQNHRKVILEMHQTRETLKFREKEIVNEQFLKNPLCMNLQIGGGGGFINEEHRQRFITSSRTSSLRGTTRASDIARKANQTRKLRGNMWCPHYDWTGKKHRQESKDKMSKTMKGRYLGCNNPSFGTCWVTDGVKPIKIDKARIEEFLQKGFWRGRDQSRK